MKSSRPLLIYIHGFNSAPASEKAQEFISVCQQLNKFNIQVPQLSHDPEKAIAQLENLILEAGDSLCLLVGSSLGGYYATYLAEKYQCRAVLINPAVSPVKHLGEGFLGLQKNTYTGEEYEFTIEYANFLDTLDIEPLQYPRNYLLMVQTGDDVLDYKLSLERYQHSLKVIQEGGSHRFEGFKEVILPILEFAEHGDLSSETLSVISSH